MKRRQFIMGGVAAAAAAASALPAHASGHSKHGQGHGQEPDCLLTVVGSWSGVFTAGETFSDLITFHADGTVIESRRYLRPKTPWGSMIETTAHGAWKRRWDGKYEVFMRVIIQRTKNGRDAATDNIRMVLDLDIWNHTLSGTFDSEVKDLQGNVVLTSAGTYTATQITV